MKSAAMRKESYEQTYEVKPPMHDKMALWENSPELRETVRDDLRNWAAAYRGGWPKLGYPTKEPYYTPPRRRDDEPPSPPQPDLERAQVIEDAFVMMRLIAKECDEQEQARINRTWLALRLYFMGRVSAGGAAKRLRVSTRTFWRLISDGMYRIWMLAAY